MVVIPRNDALNVNPPAGDEQLSVDGSNWLWAVTAVYALSFVSASRGKLRNASGSTSI
jgi:bacteriorhodopsin